MKGRARQKNAKFYVFKDIRGELNGTLSLDSGESKNRIGKKT